MTDETFVLDDSEIHYGFFSEVCTFCRHLIGPRRCEAFPEEIPLEIWLGDDYHREPHPGDHGIQFEPVQEGDLD